MGEDVEAVVLTASHTWSAMSAGSTASVASCSRRLALYVGDLRHLVGVEAVGEALRPVAVGVEMFVRTQLGQSTDTPTWLPSAASSKRSVSLRATTAALDALYGPMRGRW